MKNNNRLDSGAYVDRLAKTDTSALPPDGGERFNRLIFARSPYLLQHAENPVEWYEWGEAAFARALTENRPVLLSIGYATCHWCHVMAHESFEDGEVAALLNRHFVCIKVDREERPDIDEFYMSVSQLMTGSGGWPLNIFMTPDKRPFFAMTYLPPRAARGVTGFIDLLANIAVLWRQQPDAVDRNCQKILDALAGMHVSAAKETTTDLGNIADNAMEQLSERFDAEYGGFGRAPKFPMPTWLNWLLEQDAPGNPAPEMALQSLRHIRQGGIWDHLGGGVHRYAVDRPWLTPHFEKMLYDQAMVALSALEAYRLTGDTIYRDTVEGIFTCVRREFMSPDGAFCSALDADSEGHEGTYYVWDSAEIQSCLGSNAPVFSRFYGVTDQGNFEGRNILFQSRDLTAFCRDEQLDPAVVAGILAECLTKLLALRETRIKPLRDGKIITAWNGLMIAALARGSAVWHGNSLAMAETAANYILKELKGSDNRLMRSCFGTTGDTPGFLEDYAFLALGLLELYDATMTARWLDAAETLVNDMLRLFRSPETGFLTTTGMDAEQMLLPISVDTDGVIPSATSSACLALVRIGWLNGRDELIDAARRAQSPAMSDMQRNPLSHLGSQRLLKMLESGPVMAALHGNVGDHDFAALHTELRAMPIPGLVIYHASSEAPTCVSICARGVCYPKAATVTELRAIINGAKLLPR